MSPEKRLKSLQISFLLGLEGRGGILVPVADSDSTSATIPCGKLMLERQHGLSQRHCCSVLVVIGQLRRPYPVRPETAI